MMHKRQYYFLVLLIPCLQMHFSAESMWAAKDKLYKVIDSLRAVPQTVGNVQTKIDYVCDLVGSLEKGVDDFVKSRSGQSGAWLELTAAVSKVQSEDVKKLAIKYFIAGKAPNMVLARYEEAKQQLKYWLIAIEHAVSAEEVRHSVYLLGVYLQSCGMPEEVASRLTPLLEEFGPAFRKEKLARILARGISLESRDHSGRSIGHYAAERGDLPILLEVVKLGLPLNATRDNKGYTILHVAARTGNSSLIKSLYQHFDDIDMNCVADDGSSPLHEAILSGNFDTVDAVLQCGGEVNLPPMKGTLAPLHLASRAGREDIVRLFIDCGAALDMRVHGKTALHYAAEGGHIKLIMLLVETYHVDPAEVSSSDGRTIFHMAPVLLQETKTTVQIAKPKKPSEVPESASEENQEQTKNDTLNQSTAVEKKKIAPDLLCNPYDGLLKLCDNFELLLKKDTKGCTALHLSAMKKNEPKCAALLKRAEELKGIDGLKKILYAKDNKGYTALQHAIELGYETIVQIFIDKLRSVDKDKDRALANVNDDWGERNITKLTMRTVLQEEVELLEAAVAELVEDQSPQRRIETIQRDLARAKKDLKESVGQEEIGQVEDIKNDNNPHRDVVGAVQLADLDVLVDLTPEELELNDGHNPRAIGLEGVGQPMVPDTLNDAEVDLSPFEFALFSAREHIIVLLQEGLEIKEKADPEGSEKRFRFMTPARGRKMLNFGVTTGTLKAVQYALDYFKINRAPGENEVLPLIPNDEQEFYCSLVKRAEENKHAHILALLSEHDWQVSNHSQQLNDTSGKKLGSVEPEKPLFYEHFLRPLSTLSFLSTSSTHMLILGLMGIAFSMPFV